VWDRWDGVEGGGCGVLMLMLLLSRVGSAGVVDRRFEWPGDWEGVAGTEDCGRLQTMD